MNNFSFAKIIAGVGPILAKETILSKIINMVDVFRISLSQGFDDNNRKYIETILKLDNSKTVMLETRWNDIRVKNISDIKVKKKQKITIDYSEYAQEWMVMIYMDYPYLWKLPVWTLIRYEQSDVVMEVKSTENDFAHCEVVEWGTVLQYDRVTFDNHILDIPFLVDKDKKDILRWLEHGIHMVAASSVKTRDDIVALKAFLQEQNEWKLKIMAKIETKEAVENLQEIIDIADGIIFVFDKIQKALKENNLTEEDVVRQCKIHAKPVVITYVLGVNTKNYELCTEKCVKKFCGLAVDAYMIETMIQEEAPLELVTQLSELLIQNELKQNDISLTDFYNETEFLVRDYIIYNVYRITQELDIKAMVGYTESGYTTARLASLGMSVPVIAFTKSDETYRYLNLLRGVKWYKISQSFNYENLKRIWKEMIRIIFKWNISLDDKIIIVQANETLKDEKTDMINGLELYKFKNI